MTDEAARSRAEANPGPTDEQRTRWERQARHFESKVHFNRLCGLKVTTWTNESVGMFLPHAEQLCNSTNGLHGGVVAALADTCGTAASLAAVGAEGFIATVSMNINYLATATSDLTAIGVCIKAGRGIQVSEVRVRDSVGTLVASAIVTSTVPAPSTSTRAPITSVSK